MTKSDLVVEISKQTGIDKVTVLETVEAFMEVVKTSVSNKQNIFLREFGSFTVKRRAQKLARNIGKGTSIIVPAHYVPVFKPSKEFVETVKQSVKA